MKKIILTLCGACIGAASLHVFLLPAGFAPGGVSGVAVVISTLAAGKLPVGAITFALNIPLFLLGYRVLGKKFTVNSLIGTVLYSLLTDGMGFALSLVRFSSMQGEPFLNAVYGGLFLGLGLGLIFRGGATTGGTDIAARVLQTKLSWLTLGQLVLAFDVMLLAVVAVSYQSLTAALYSGVAVVISSKVIDAVEGGVNYAKQVYIVLSDETAAGGLADAVMNKLRRGVTEWDGRGMHSKVRRPILMCVVGNRQISVLRRLVKQFDEDAFVIVSDVREIQGMWKK